MLNSVIEEVGIDENVVGGDEGGVVLEEYVVGYLGDFVDDVVIGGFFGCLFFCEGCFNFFFVFF